MRTEPYSPARVKKPKRVLKQGDKKRKKKEKRRFPWIGPGGESPYPL